MYEAIIRRIDPSVTEAEAEARGIRGLPRRRRTPDRPTPNTPHCRPIPPECLVIPHRLIVRPLGRRCLGGGLRAPRRSPWRPVVTWAVHAGVLARIRILGSGAKRVRNAAGGVVVRMVRD